MTVQRRAQVVRGTCLVLFVAAIAAMIAANVAGESDLAVAIGVAAAFPVVVLLTVTWVTGPTRAGRAAADDR